jgi:hypothetical protein
MFCESVGWLRVSHVYTPDLNLSTGTSKWIAKKSNVERGLRACRKIYEGR